jgi:hypothetical protein
MKVYIVLGEHGGCTEVDLVTTDSDKAAERFEKLVIDEGCAFTKQEAFDMWEENVLENSVQDGDSFYATEGDDFSYRVVESEVEE